MTELALVPLAMAAPHGVPREIATVCILTGQMSRYWNSTRALSELKRDGHDGGVPAAAAQVQAALVPADGNRLADRLTALGMMMAPNRGAAEATVWLGEMKRLLGDLPEDILGEAIDACVKMSRFLPTVAEIRDRADPIMDARRRLFSQLDAMARLIASGADVRPAQPKRDGHRSAPDQPMNEAEIAELNAMLERLGATSRFRPDNTRYTVERETGEPRKPGPARMPTAADYISLGLSAEEAERAVADRSKAPA